MLAWFRRSTASPRPAARSASWRPGLESLEDRATPTASSLGANFSGVPLLRGSYLWFHSEAKVSGLGSAPATINVTNQSISFTANGTKVKLDVPDTAVTLTPGSKEKATTSFSDATGWTVSAPGKFNGEVFLSGLAYQLPTTLPRGIKNVTWTGDFTSSVPGLKVQWNWSAEVYAKFSANEADLGVKAVDDKKVDAYKNSDPAGTPQNFKAGPWWWGWFNGPLYQAAHSGTKKVTPGVASPPTVPTAPASLAGTVFDDANFNGQFDAGEGLGGVALTLTGTNDLGQAVTLNATTATDGSYSFTNLRPGTYTLTEAQPENYNGTDAAIGTAGGTAGWNVVNGIMLGSGQNGTGYNFLETAADAA